MRQLGAGATHTWMRPRARRCCVGVSVCPPTCQADPLRPSTGSGSGGVTIQVSRLPRARRDAQAVGALLSSGTDLELVLRQAPDQTARAVQWLFGCLGFNRAHDNVEVTETPPEAWRGSNVRVIVDDDKG